MRSCRRSSCWWLLDPDQPAAPHAPHISCCHRADSSWHGGRGALKPICPAKPILLHHRYEHPHLSHLPTHPTPPPTATLPQASWHALPHTFNAQKVIKLHHPHLWRPQELCVIHYVDEKPW